MGRKVPDMTHRLARRQQFGEGESVSERAHLRVLSLGGSEK